MKSRLEQLLDELLRQIDIPAMEQAMSKQYKSQIRRRWELPADYWMLLERCCGLRTVWSNDTYEALELWGLDTLVEKQSRQSLSLCLLYHFLLHLRIPYLRGVLEFSAFCCFLDRNCNSYCHTNHWVVTSAD